MKTTSNLDRNALLRQAVVEDPENDLAKQVFADQLLQLQDPRGELIQIELALDAPLSIRKRETLKARHAELLKKHGATWFPYKVGAYRTHAGFIRAVSATFKQLAAAPELFANEPVVEVEVSCIDEESGEKLAKATWLARVRQLTVRGAIGDASFASLWTAKPAQQLRSLNVVANELSGDALGELDGALPKLETLVLTANAIGDDGVAGLRAWQHLDTLRTLYLSKCDLSAAGVDALLAGAPLGRLEKLTLSGNRLAEVGAVIAKHAAKLPALRHLELCDCRIGPPTIAAIMGANLPALAKLDARKNGLPNSLVDEHGARVRV